MINFAGRSNIEAPVTTLTITPTLPNGDNGYYNQRPTVSFNVDDKESYGYAEYSTDNINYNKYSDHVDLLDGDYTLSYLSYDNYGLAEDLNAGIENGKLIVGDDFSVVYNKYELSIINRFTKNIIILNIN